MADTVLREAELQQAAREQAAWHRVKRRLSQVVLYPEAQRLLRAVEAENQTPNERRPDRPHERAPGHRQPRGGRREDRTGERTAHQISNLINLALAAQSPEDIAAYLDHQSRRDRLQEFYRPLVQMFQDWRTGLVTQAEQEVRAVLGTKEQPAKTLLSLSRSRFLLDLFLEFCQHLRAHHAYLIATQGGH
ncbi:MAG: hypothetical protein OZSIB_1617 [Candidatus Ozemobacter sibiricus]|jgi:hypothetical protein|uniref:Uncharacterized protein n=1 Tax=Candidatus Ozemobacter sibiricus TaxID=2268124 RepID=A0A367ZJN2_9BACT|nr:MAG: hypothetical protein OZSIB_1617 [Candidatus Ozemobacter sibiricus]